MGKANHPVEPDDDPPCHCPTNFPGKLRIREENERCVFSLSHESENSPILEGESVGPGLMPEPVSGTGLAR